METNQTFEDFKCVCVCESTSVSKSLIFPNLSCTGGNGPFMSPFPTKLLMNWEDITTDHRDVPANFHGDETMFGFCLLVFCVEQAVWFSSSASLPFLHFPN